MARRSNGEGTAYRYQGGFRAVAVINGKRRYFRAPTHREAMDKMRQARLQASAAPDWNPDADDPTCGEWLDYWLENVKRSAVEPSTYESYRGLIDRHLIPILGPVRLSELNFSHTDDLHHWLLARNLSVSTIKQARSVLGQALRIARQRGKVSRNVITDTDPPRGPRRTVDPLPPEHAAAILNADHSPRDTVRWGLALLYGLRQGEALALKWQDLDLDSGDLSITRALKRRRGGGLVLADTKTPKSRRQVRLDSEILETLKVHRREQAAQRLAAGCLWQDDNLIFTTGIGTPVHPSDDWKAWARLLKKLGIPHKRLHDARHTAATLTYKAGSSLDDVQLLLGHSSLDFTRRTYVHTQHVDTTASIQQIRRALAGSNEESSEFESA
jgi:integrase